MQLTNVALTLIWVSGCKKTGWFFFSRKPHCLEWPKSIQVPQRTAITLTWDPLGFVFRCLSKQTCKIALDTLTEKTEKSSSFLSFLRHPHRAKFFGKETKMRMCWKFGIQNFFFVSDLRTIMIWWCWKKLMEGPPESLISNDRGSLGSIDVPESC